MVRVKGLDLRGGVTPAWSPAVETVHRTVSLYRLCSSPLDYKTKKNRIPDWVSCFFGAGERT